MGYLYFMYFKTQINVLQLHHLVLVFIIYISIDLQQDPVFAVFNESHNRHLRKDQMINDILHYITLVSSPHDTSMLSNEFFSICS